MADRQPLNRFIDIGFQRNRFATAHPPIGGDDKITRAILDAAADRIGRKPTETHRMNRTNPCAGKHSVGCFRHHRHINRHSVALGNA